MAGLALTGSEIEAANRGEATSLLIRCGYRVYRPEADCAGEDLVIRHPKGALFAVQQKGRLTVNYSQYGKQGLWMLFPSAPFKFYKEREWYLVDHEILYAKMEERHSHAPSWEGSWTVGRPSVEMKQWLEPYRLDPDRVLIPPR